MLTTRPISLLQLLTRRRPLFKRFLLRLIALSLYVRTSNSRWQFNIQTDAKRTACNTKPVCLLHARSIRFPEELY